MLAGAFKTTKSTHAVSSAFRERGFYCVYDGFNEPRSVKRTREQVWAKDMSDTVEIRFHVYFNRDGHVTGFSSGHGYAETHGEGRHLGVWRRPFTPKQCRELLLSSLADAVSDERQHLYAKRKA